MEQQHQLHNLEIKNFEWEMNHTCRLLREEQDVPLPE